MNFSTYHTQQIQSHSDSTVFARNLLSSLESRFLCFEQCDCIDDYTQLKFKDMIEFIVKKGDDTGITWFCDMCESVNLIDL